MAAKLNMQYVRAREFIIPGDDHDLNLVLVGCGGTGSWLAPTIARLARLLAETKRKMVHTVFIDPDRVEPRNVHRQHFCDAEVGSFKAESLAFRYGTAWGVNITAINAEFDPDRQIGHLRGTTVLIGCVDNAAARRSLHKFARTAFYEYGGARYYLDAGNWKNSGQVLLGGGPRQGKTFPLDGLCARLPLPATQHPELLEDIRVDEGKDDPELALSCADLALRGSQGLSVNQTVAAVAGHYLLSMLLTGGLRTFQTYFDLPSGTMSSTCITPRVVNALLKSEKKGGSE